MDIVTTEDIRPADIAEIRLFVGDYHDLMCRPLDERKAPKTLVDAKFSLPFLVAVAAVRRGASVRDFTEAGLRDADVLATASKVTLAPDSNLDWKLELPPGRVEIVTQDGRRFAKTGTQVPGNADNPMTWEGVAAKFVECAAAAVTQPSTEIVQRTQELARRLETLTDATEILRVLAGAETA
jgi:2-methylcitrate dehydratase PrpD